MNTLTRAELLKLRSTRILGWILVGTLVMVLVTIIASVPTPGSTNNVVSLDEPALLARIVGVGPVHRDEPAAHRVECRDPPLRRLGRTWGQCSELMKQCESVGHPPVLDDSPVLEAAEIGHELRWRNDAIGQAAVALPESDTEIVLTTEHGYEPNWLVHSADEAAARMESGGGRVLALPFDIPVGRVAVVEDPFGNVLVLIDLSKGRYDVDAEGHTTGVV